MAAPALNAIIDQKSGKIIVQQPLPAFNCLVLEGAGVRGSAYPGAFKVFSKFGLSQDFKHVAGSSAGAIAILLYALGYSQEEIAQELNDLPMEEFTEKSAQLLITPTLWAKAKMAWQILRSKENALSSGQAMQKWLEARVERKLGKKDATFADLKAKVESKENQTAKDAVKYLYVSATNISLKVPESEVFSHKRTPGVSIATAVRASGTFPYIFAPVEINGCKYFDGGGKNNLPCNTFDSAEFLPPGFTFNEKGLNPGVLAIKIDSRDEINQVMWGIRKNNKLESISEYSGAVAYACTDNIDANEMRNARTVVALPDQDIGSLNFTIGTDGKLRLSSSAEDAAQEFLENMVGAAYKTDTYKDITSWLDALTLDELHQIIARYKIMAATAPKNKQTTNDDPLRFDANNPTAQEIENYITFINKYVDYRTKKFEKPETSPPICEAKHINLPPAPSANKWEEIVKTTMQHRIDVMRRNIETTQARITGILAEFSEDDENLLVQHLHNDQFDFDTIKLLTGYVEYHDIMVNEIAELEMKLGVRNACYSPETYNTKYPLFAKQIAAYSDDNNKSSALKAIVGYIDIFNPVITYKSSHANDNVIFSYNLRNKLDCKIFMIAMILYLEHRKAKEAPVLAKLYRSIFPGEQCPKSMYALSTTFPNIKTSMLLTHAYRVEELLLLFARRENPTTNPDINLDNIFNAYKSFFTGFLFKKKAETYSKTEDLSSATPLQNIFRAKVPSSEKDHEPFSRQYRTK